MLSFLERIVTIQSGTANKDGVDRVGEVFVRFMDRIGFFSRRYPQVEYGDHLVFANRRQARGRQVLLVGHMDTIFPADTEFTEFVIDGDTVTGPGVIDMKGGLTAGVFALAALADLDLLSEVPVALLCNSDEEMGSPTSGALIRAEAAKSAFAFVLEAGGPDNQVVTARKGNLSAVLTVQGRAGHAAFAGPEKASAVLELAHRILAVEALNRPEEGISANVGQVRGGLGANSVPDRAEARIDVRFKNPGDGKALLRQLETAAECGIEGTSCRLDIRSHRPPMPECDANRRLYETLSTTARSLGRPIAPEYRPGVSDANLIADEKVPVLDGLGPIGGRDHSPDEYMIRQSLLERATLIACGLLDCWEAVREADRS
jgi:glutamate carboxypeptidase